MKENGRVFLSHVLLGESPAFPSAKKLEHHVEKLDAADIVYEDEHTIAYVQHDADAGSDTSWALRIEIALKDHVPTLLDLDVADVHATTSLLRAIQAVAFKFKLYNAGFEIRCDVMPPGQRKGFLEIKLRSGKHKTMNSESAAANSESAPTNPESTPTNPESTPTNSVRT